MSAWPKALSCGRVVTAAEWFALPLVGRSDIGTEDEIELRNCVAPCLSTHSVLASDLPSTDQDAA